VLNRLLRHEVLNKVNVVAGYAGRPDGGPAVRRAARHIDEAVRKAGVLARADRPRAVALAPVLESVVADYEPEHERPASTSSGAIRADGEGSDIDTGTDVDPVVRLDGSVPDVTVLAGEGLRDVFDHLVDNAVAHGEPPATVSATATDRAVAVTVTDRGAGLPAEQVDLLTGGSLPAYDDPTVGFG
jgi:signal transduction histidine kinase